MDIQVILYILIAATLAVAYSLRRIFLLEKKILRVEQAILKLERTVKRKK